MTKLPAIAAALNRQRAHEAVLYIYSNLPDVISHVQPDFLIQ
ncbi:hypothetical protein KKH3_38040 [Pectobacterium actinidiae]|nr:hypothetical protein KKH3_38040 [Pectobacterium actinidiae]